MTRHTPTFIAAKTRKLEQLAAMTVAEQRQELRLLLGRLIKEPTALDLDQAATVYGRRCSLLQGAAQMAREINLASGRTDMAEYAPELQARIDAARAAKALRQAPTRLHLVK